MWPSFHGERTATRRLVWLSGKVNVRSEARDERLFAPPPTTQTSARPPRNTPRVTSMLMVRGRMWDGCGPGPVRQFSHGRQPCGKFPGAWFREAKSRMRWGALIGILSVVAGLLGLAGTATGSTQATAVGSGGAAASVDADATRVAIKVLRHGGHAADAAVAANATLGVTEPYVAGVGGGGFMVIYLAREHRVVTIDARETAPIGFPQDAFIEQQTGKPIPLTPERVTSGMAVGVPGTLASWAAAERRFGTMSLARLVRPAIRVARRGFTVDQTFHDQTQSNLARLGAFSSSRALFLTPDGQAPPVGSIIRNRDLAKTYRLIASRGARVFYRGPIGAAVADTVDHPPADSRST